MRACMFHLSAVGRQHMECWKTWLTIQPSGKVEKSSLFTQVAFLGCMIRLISCHLWLGAGAEWRLKNLSHAKMALVRCSDHFTKKWCSDQYAQQLLPLWYGVPDILFVLGAFALKFVKKMKNRAWSMVLIQFKNKAHISANWKWSFPNAHVTKSSTRSQGFSGLHINGPCLLWAQ